MEPGCVDRPSPGDPLRGARRSQAGLTLVLLDTNVLVYAIDESAVLHAPCRAVVEQSMSGQLDAVLFPQILTEFYAVVTSPRRVRSPVGARDAIGQVSDWRRTIPIRYPNPACLETWSELVRVHAPVGREIHDVFLVAQMRSHDVREICTVNADDFARFRELVVRSPASLA